MKKLFLYGALLGTIVSVAGASTTALAATFPDKDATDKSTAEARGKVKFVNSDQGTIPDPTDPVTPIDPIDPVNPSENPLRIQHVSNFNFNQRRMSGATALVFNAESVPVQSIYADSEGKKEYKGRDDSEKDQNGEKIDSAMFGDLSSLDIRETIPFISTMDMRTERGNGWEMTAQAAPFKLHGTEVELKGAEIRLANSFYAKSDANAPKVEDAAAAKVPFFKVDKGMDMKDYNAHMTALDTSASISSGSATKIASAGVDQGVGGYTLALGDNLQNDQNDLSPKMVDDGETADTFYSTNGVILKIPAKTAMELGKENEHVDRDNKKTETNEDIMKRRDSETEGSAFYRTTITWTLTPGVI